MARKVGPGSKTPRSTAKKQALRLPRVPDGHKFRAKPDFIIDDRPSQRSKGRPTPTGILLEKGKFKKLKGTRVQSLPGGAPVRVIIEDGKRFDPVNLRGAKMHLAKLAQQAEELARNRGQTIPTVDAGVEQPSKIRANVRPRTATADDAIPPLSKKARRAKEQEERRKERAAKYEATLHEEQREILSDEWCEGEVLQRARSQAWVRLLRPPSFVQPVLQRIREQSDAALELWAEEVPARWAKGEDILVLPVLFSDAARGLDLRAGVSLRLKIFSSARGVVGGCQAEATSCNTPPAKKPAPATAALEATTEENSRTAGKSSRGPQDVAELRAARQAAAKYAKQKKANKGLKQTSNSIAAKSENAS